MRAQAPVAMTLTRTRSDAGKLADRSMLLLPVALGVVLAVAACDSSTSPDTSNLPTPIMFESARDGGFGLYLTSTDGRRVMALDVGHTERTGDWSPDGHQVVFTRTSPQPEIWLANADGSQVVQLTHSGGNATEARWMPNGGGISYVDGTAPYTSVIQAMKPDGSGLHPVPNTTNIVRAYSWSPDGRLVFARMESITVPGVTGYVSVYNLYIADTTQTSAVQLTSNTDCGDTEPEWSPDGSKIVFEHCSGNKSSIVVIAPDGTGRTELTSGDDVDVRPTWSPDGSQIAFQRGVLPDSTDVWVMSANGSNQLDITRGHVGFDGAPKWWRLRPVP